jgi:hypothetical protein
VTEEQQGKGRPTPKRSEAQKRRGGPVMTPPTNRKEAARQLRARNAEARLQAKQGKQAGRPAMERPLLPRDSGPVRKLVRDTVDSRRNVAGFLLPMALAVFVSGAIDEPRVRAMFLGLWLATLLACALDFILLSSLIRRRIRGAHPQESKLGGHVFYGILRSTVIRRMRMPRPAVVRGQKL